MTPDPDLSSDKDRPGPPIVVDLDGTLLLTDTLEEGVAALGATRPLGLLQAALALRSGRAAFKRAVAERITLDVELLPARQDLVAWLGERRAEGRSLHLVTAADQTVADAVAKRFDLFDSAVGSRPERNLKGQAKADFLAGRFPEGFVYCGDSAADVPVFRKSAGAVLCDVAPATQAQVARAGTPVVARFDAPPFTPKEAMRLLRVHQWTKNLLVFVPLFVGHVFLDPRSIGRSIAAFLLLSILASGTYLANDLSDLANDRRHPGRSRRAFASGRMRLRAGFIAAPLMTLGALLTAFLIDATFGGTMLFYLALTGLYSAGLKRIALVDVFVIGTLFTTRILIGAAVLDLTQSVWLLSFSMFLFFSLALAKRHVELVGAAGRGETLLGGRGYLVSDAPLTLAFGVGAGLTSVLIMLLFMTAEAAPSGFYRNPAWLFATPAALTLWIMRIWLQSHRGTLHDDPVVFALKDRVSLGLALVIAIALALAL